MRCPCLRAIGPSRGGLHERARARQWVLLGDFGKERVAGVLAETRRPAQGRALREFREAEDTDRFECCAFAVADVLQSA